MGAFKGFRGKRFSSAVPVLAVSAAALLPSAAARADRAVVIGVQRYVNLPERANQLKGCVNDARSMKGALERYGFAVTLLVNEEATKKNILDVIQKESGLIKPSERFVFYFAGHGTDTPKPSLLPHDALADRTLNHLTTDDLYRAVVAVPAYSHTVLLDSCFSGGMARSLNKLQQERPGARARYYPTLAIKPDGSSRSPVPVPLNSQDTNKNIAGGAGSSDVCYYVASLGNEKAMEESFNGTDHGVFTYFLVSQLDGDRELWKNIHTTVKGKVVDYLFDWQHPTFSPAPFLQAPVFEAKAPATGPGTPPEVEPTAPSTVWETYNTDYPDPARVSVTMQPNRTSVAVGEQFRFTTRVGTDGYLILLERDVEGKVYLLFPKNGKVESAKVRAGKDINIPEDAANAYSPDTPGTEHIKAILFTGRDKAAALLGALGQGGRDGVPLAGMKRLQEVPAKSAPFFTSEIVFEVTEKPKPGAPTASANPRPVKNVIASGRAATRKPR